MLLHLFICFEHTVLIIPFTYQVNVWWSANSIIIWYVAVNGCTYYQVTFDSFFTSRVFAFFFVWCVVTLVLYFRSVNMLGYSQPM